MGNKKATIKKATMAVDASGGVIPLHDGNANSHLAFSIATDDLEQWKNWLSENNIAIERRISN